MWWSLLPALSYAASVHLVADVPPGPDPSPLVDALAASGHAVTVDPEPAASFAGELDDVDVVVLLMDATPGAEVPPEGQDALLASHEAGGGFVGSGHLAWAFAGGAAQALDELVLLDLPALTSAPREVVLTAAGLAHPMTYGLSPSFTYEGASTVADARLFAVAPVDVLAVDATGAPVVVVREDGHGRAVGLAFAPTLEDPVGTGAAIDEVGQLYAAAVTWAAPCEPVDSDGDGAAAFPCGADCDDADPRVGPGAPGWCDVVDADCDGVADTAWVDARSLYEDLDGDGYGSLELVEQCAGAVGTAPVGGDCDDGDPDVHPAAEEQCDGVDQDCDGAIDDHPVDGQVFWVDGDGDGYGEAVGTWACEPPAGESAHPGDCDDGDPVVHPDGTELCNGADDDCDGLIDNAAVDAFEAWPDVDGDGYGAEGEPSVTCDPAPGAASEGGDCDDLDPGVNPGAKESCAPGDQDCDGFVDEAPVDGTRYYPDQDGDGFGDEDGGVVACVAPAGWVDRGADCDDADPDAFPGAPGWSLTCDRLDVGGRAVAPPERGCAIGGRASGGYFWAPAVLFWLRRRSAAPGGPASEAESAATSTTAVPR